MWRVVRYYKDHPGGLACRTLKTRLSKEDAERHCNSVDANSATARGKVFETITFRVGPWRDLAEEYEEKPREKRRNDKDRSHGRKRADFRAVPA